MDGFHVEIPFREGSGFVKGNFFYHGKTLQGISLADEETMPGRIPDGSMMAIGVARTRAHGQNTTRIVTARMISPVKSQVRAAAKRAITTIQVAKRSARPTIFAFPASADG